MRKMIVGIMYLVFAGVLLAGCAATGSPQADVDDGHAWPKQSNEITR